MTSRLESMLSAVPLPSSPAGYRTTDHSVMGAPQRNGALLSGDWWRWAGAPTRVASTRRVDDSPNLQRLWLLTLLKNLHSLSKKRWHLSFAVPRSQAFALRRPPQTVPRRPPSPWCVRRPSPRVSPASAADDKLTDHPLEPTAL